MPGPSVPPAGEAHPRAAVTLVERFRDEQRAVFMRSALLWALVVLVGGLAVALLLSPVALGVTKALLLFVPLLAVGVFVGLGPQRARRRIGDARATAKRVGEVAPELNLDLLAAVELSQALGERHDFSPDLARAFVAQVNARAARQNVASLVDRRPVSRAGALLVAVVLLSVGALTWRGAAVAEAMSKAFSVNVKGLVQRTPITGDFEITYRYPAYTGLASKTVQSNGEITAPVGTQVVVKTRADRDIEAAAYDVNGVRVPVTRNGRDLTGEFVVAASGQYHVVFLDGARAVAEGPDLPLQAEVDKVPEVRLLGPADDLELDPEKLRVLLKFEASDDYGLSGLDLVYRPTGGAETRVPLHADDGRVTRGDHAWDLGGLKLKAGQAISYFIEARDNDAAGVKKGVSKTQRLRIYSAAQHRREALAKIEALWEKLVLHLADRIETGDRMPAMTLPQIQAGAAVDARAQQISQDLQEFVNEQLREREPLDDVISATANVRSELEKDTSSLLLQRAVLLRRSDDATRAGMAPRLAALVQNDIGHSEKNVLYLESLLDRQKLDALKEMAKELREERQALSQVLEQYKDTKDAAVQEQLLQQMNDLRQRMIELQQRMAELSKGIRDEHINREALREMMQEQDMNSSLDDVEKLIREGKADEAMKKMQELSMQMDDFLNNLEQAGEKADEQADPELAEKFQAFNEELQQTVEQQEKLAERTRQLRDKTREQAKERLKRDGDAVKRELMPKLEDLRRSLSEDAPLPIGPQMAMARDQALKNVEATKQALEANQFDLALDAAQDLEQAADSLKAQAADYRRRDEMFKNPSETRKASKALDERMGQNQQRAEEVARKLESLFPQNGQQMSEADQQQMREMAQQQKKLGQQAGQLQQQMEGLNERAPLFDENAMQQMEQAGQRMEGAGQKLGQRDANRGYGEQQGALQSLKGLQQQMQQQSQRPGSRGKGLPMPMSGGRPGGRSGRGGLSNDKVEIPDEDPNAAPREFRKDVMDVMKQGAPDRYKEQNKRYYEELVK